MCYLHIKQIAIFQERRAIWKNYRWSSFIISRDLSNKTNLIFISYTLLLFKSRRHICFQICVTSLHAFMPKKFHYFSTRWTMMYYDGLYLLDWTSFPPKSAHQQQLLRDCYQNDGVLPRKKHSYWKQIWRRNSTHFPTSTGGIFLTKLIGMRKLWK